MVANIRWCLVKNHFKNVLLVIVNGIILNAVLVISKLTLAIDNGFEEIKYCPECGKQYFLFKKIRGV